VAAQEQQGQRVIPAGVQLVGRRGGGRWPRLDRNRRFLPAAPGLLAAQQIGQPPRRDRDQPSLGAGGQAPVRPLLRRRDQGLLDRVLGQAKVAVAAHHRRQDLRGKVAQQALEVVDAVRDLLQARVGDADAGRRNGAGHVIKRSARNVGGGWHGGVHDRQEAV